MPPGHYGGVEASEGNSALRLQRLLFEPSGRRLGEASGQALLTFSEGRVWQRETGRVAIGGWRSTFSQVLLWELDQDGRPRSLTCGGLRVPLERALRGLVGEALCGADRYRAVVRGSRDGWMLAFCVDGPAKAYRSVTRYSALPGAQVPSSSRRTSSGSDVVRTIRAKGAPWSSITTPGPWP